MDRVTVLHRDRSHSDAGSGPEVSVVPGQQAMKIRVLGCSGGIGGALRTTALLVDDDVLVDAGTGVGDLSLESLARIDHIFVSHSHLDHVTSIPFLVDTVCWMRASPLVVYGIKEVLDILKAHLFNWKIWPDFTQIPDGDKPFMVYRELRVGDVHGRGRVRAEPEVFITHLKPGEGALTMKEVTQAAGRWRPRMLENNQEFSL